MKKKLLIITLASAASLLPFAAQASESPDSKADNSGRNVRDRNSTELTPLDQGNSPADRNTTAQIRKQIMALDEMSMNAKNVKIITANGKVTLRGPVDSKGENGQIAKIAAKIAGVKNVNNLLEIKTTAKQAN